MLPHRESPLRSSHSQGDRPPAIPSPPAAIAPLFSAVSVPADALIFSEGDPAVHLYVVMQGEVHIRYKPYDGPPITISRIGPASVFGWSAVVNRPVYTSSACAAQASELIRIKGADLRQLCQDRPATGILILDRLAEQVSSRWTNAREQVREMLAQSLSG